MVDPSPKTRPLIVKIGGSLADSGRLPSILTTIAASNVPLIVVPGGGEFANKVRDLQNALKFDDASAHKLAILGMHQMAEIYFKLQPRLAAADSLEGFQRVAAAGQIPVWLPWQMCASDQDIPANWSITSDGIAARLAERLGGADLVLLKSVDVAPGTRADDLARDGIVDAAFPQIVHRAKLNWRILGPGQEAELRASLSPSLTGRGPAADATNEGG